MESKIDEELLALITNEIGEQVLKKTKKNISSIIESLYMKSEVQNVLKKLSKNELHDLYERIAEIIKNHADDKGLYDSILKELEKKSKSKY